MKGTNIMATKRSLKNRMGGIPQHYLTGRTSVETREAVVPQPTAIPAPLAPKAPTVACLLAPALQDLLTANGFDPKTVRLRGERSNPDELDQLAIFIDGSSDDETDEYGDVLPNQANYSVRLAVGETTIFEKGLIAEGCRGWPDEDLDGPQAAADAVLAQFGVQLQEDDSGISDGYGEWFVSYNVARADVPAGA
jgi:hypothetical protein